jgi:hypothetical protein
MKRYDVLAMFSGGLDSILAAKTVAAQGLSVLCLHFVSPFFGHPDKIEGWRTDYGLDIEAVDVGPQYVDMMHARPVYGVGKGMNPCVDCKILMLRRCRELLDVYGAKFIVTGEVKGQRPMSQRRDALDVISRDAGVRDVLLRPLCARTMKPTPMEEAGLIDRERLHAFGGRTRKPQFRLAREMGVTKFPQPAGGCKLTEYESAKRYVPVFQHASPPTDADFHLANVGRQFWAGPHWMAMGRNREDNETLARLARPGDTLLDVVGFPSPLGLVRPLPGADWSGEALSDAAALLASYATKAAASGGPVQVLTRLVTDAQTTGTGSPGETMPWPAGEDRVLIVAPSRTSRLGLADVDWEELIPVKKAMFGESQEDDGY